MKLCARCGNVKEDEDFNWRLTGSRRQSICRDCQRDSRREHYESHTQQEIDRTRGRRIEARERAKEFVFDYLSHHVSEVCGEYRPEALQFDHVRGTKTKDISRMAQDGTSIESIKREILKTRVICANCHQMAERRRREGRAGPRD